VATGGGYQPQWFSAIGQNYQTGMGYGETVTRAVLGSNPLTGVGMASYDLTSSALRGDWGGVAEGAGGLVGGFAAAKYGQRYLAPEPGAELGFYRQRVSVDVVDPNGMAATLPGGHGANFISAEPIHLGGRTLNRVFDTIDPTANGAKANGGYWSEKVYTDEPTWRMGVAVPKSADWNRGTLQAEWQPTGGWGWGGRAAPQVLGQPYSFTNQKLGFGIGWIQRGGDYQVFVPNSYKPTVIPPSAITVSPTPWSKQ